MGNVFDRVGNDESTYAVANIHVPSTEMETMKDFTPKQTVRTIFRNRKHACVYIRTWHARCVWTFVCVYMHAYTCICTQACTYACKYVRACIYRFKALLLQFFADLFIPTPTRFLWEAFSCAPVTAQRACVRVYVMYMSTCRPTQWL